MPTIGLSVYVDSGVVLLPAHTALHALSCRTHTRPRTPDCSTSYRWWRTVVVSTRPGRVGQKPEPAVRFRRNHSNVCRAEPSSRNLLNTSNTRSWTRRSGSFSRRSSPLIYPAGEATISSPRFAFSRPGPPRNVVAAGLIHIRSKLPFNPSNRRSLLCRGV
jgi:hypothetical protein